MNGFEGFDDARITVGSLETRCRTGGSGPPVLLLHGYPESHATWHRVAPMLERQHRLVIPDLPGYGDSTLDEVARRNVDTFSKRNMAASMLAVMKELGHDRFAVVGHDRGARVAYRMALDHPEAVSHLAVLDIVPTLDEWAVFDRLSSIDTFHWPVLAQPSPLPEHLIGQDPDFFLDHLMQRWASDVDNIDPDALIEYRRCFRRAEVIEATCNDYRAGAVVDVEHDRADREANRRIACPVLTLASRGRGSLEETWRQWADDLTGGVIDGGHFLQEEAPAATAQALLNFLAT